MSRNPTLGMKSVSRDKGQILLGSRSINIGKQTGPISNEVREQGKEPDSAQE